MVPRSDFVLARSFAVLLFACLLVVAVFIVGFDALVWRIWLNLPQMPSLAIRAASAGFIAAAGVVALRYLLAGIPNVPPPQAEGRSSNWAIAPRRCFWIVCALLGAAAVIPAPVAWRASEDVRNFFPLITAFTVVQTLGYAFSYTVIAYIGRFNVRTVAVQHVIVGFLQIALTLLYYLDRPDWGAVNRGQVQLTPIQSVVYNHATPWLIYALSLVLALIAAIAARHRSSGGSPPHARSS